MPSCKLPNCTIAKDGRCLEGRGAECPNLIRENASELPESAVPTEGSNFSVPNLQTYPATEALYSGLPLEIAEAQELSRRGRAIVVVLAGMTESGKTSLLARLHQQFQGGPVGGYDFAESRTLPRFEELNWLATLESGVGAPTMKHSSRLEDNSLLHFAVRRRDSCAPETIDLLLNDISGETFPDAIAAESVCEQLVCLPRADHLGLVVDGAALADRSRRHDHCAKAKNFVERVLQTQQIGKSTVLHLVITKLDELRRGDHAVENEQAATDLEAEFVSRFTPKVAKIHCWRVAARPRDGSMPTVTTIADLFAMRIGSTYRYLTCRVPDPDLRVVARDFCRFGI